MTQRPKTNQKEASQSAKPGSVPANTFAGASDMDEKFIKFKENRKLDKVAELASEMISAY